MRLLRFMPAMAGLTIFLVPSLATAEGKPIGIMDVIQQTIVNHPNVLIGKQSLKATRGSVQTAQGSFDWLLNGNASHTQAANNGPFDLGNENYEYGNQSDLSAMGVSVSKLLPWGMSVSGGANLTRSSNEIETTFPGSSTVSSTPLVATVSFSVTQPLLRGRGLITRAELDARNLELEAVESEYKQSIIVQVRSSISSYWAYVAAYQFLAASKDREARALRLLKDNKKLVQADLRPAAELRQLEANYSDTKRDRYQAEQSVIASRYRLGAAMGLEAIASSAIGIPSTKIPQPPEINDSNLSIKKYLASAFSQRSDLQALGFRTKAAKVRMAAADNDKLPNLDLTGTLQYAGLGSDDDYTRDNLLAGRTDLLGYTATLNLNFSWPPQNNVADGVFTQRVAQHRIAQESERALKQQIGSNVSSSVSEVQKSAKIAYEGLQAARLYEESVLNEEKKLKAGLSTLINLVLTQERLAGARTNAISGLRAYAESLLAFRFATGTLFGSKSNKAEIKLNKVLSFPGENEE